MNLFNLTDDFDINSASIDFRNDFLRAFREIEDQHSLGVYVSKEVHIKFHSAYGYGWNTEEQFIEFVSNFFPEKLEILLKYIKETTKNKTTQYFRDLYGKLRHIQAGNFRS